MTDFLRLGEYTPWGNSGTLLTGQFGSHTQPSGYKQDSFDRVLDFLNRHKWKLLFCVAIVVTSIWARGRFLSRKGIPKAGPPPAPEQPLRIDERATQRLLAGFGGSRPVPPIGTRPPPAVPPQTAAHEEITALLFWNPTTKKFTMKPDDPLAGVMQAHNKGRPPPANAPTRVVMNLDDKYAALRFSLTQEGIEEGLDQLRGLESSLPLEVCDVAGITLGRDLRALVGYLRRYRHGI